MDPDACLTEIRDLLNEPDEKRDHLRLADLVSGLDDWLGSNGYLPEAWQGVDHPRADPEPRPERHRHDY